MAWKKWLATALITVLLGALGSGLWELVVKSMGGWFLQAILSVATLGLASLRDQMYVEISKDGHNHYGYLTSLLLVWAASIVVGNTLAKGMSVRETIKQALGKNSESRISSLPSEWKLTFMYFILPIFLGTIILLMQIRANFIEDAASNMRRAIRMSAPFMTTEQALRTEARFASIRSRSDYVSLYDEVKSLAHANGVEVPKLALF